MRRIFGSPLARAPAALAVGVLIAAAILTRFVPPDTARDLHPWPDAVEYVVGARSLAEHGRVVVAVNQHELPSRYPVGFSLLLAPVFLVPGAEYGDAILMVLLLDLVLLVLTYRLGSRVFSRPAGIIAAWLVVVSPLDVLLATLILSDIAATVCILAVVAILIEIPWSEVRGMPRRAAGMLAAAGGVLAFAVWIRLTQAIFVVPVIAAVGCFGAAGSRRWQWFVRGAQPAAVMLAAFAVCYAPVLVSNHVKFGSVLRTGYHYWLPSLLDRPTTMFSVGTPEGVGPSIAKQYRDATLGLPQWTRLGSLVHNRLEPVALYSPIAPALAALAAWIIVRRRWRGDRSGPEPGSADRQGRFLGLTAAVVGVNFLFHATYVFDSRFLHVSVPLIAVLAGGGLTAVMAWCRVAIVRAHWRRAEAVVPLTVVLALGASTAGQVTGGALWRSLMTHEPLYRAEAYEQMKLIREATEDDAVIVGDWPPVFFTAYQRGTGRTILPLRANEPLPPHISLPAAFSDTVALGSHVDDGRPVYYAGDAEQVSRVVAEAGLALERRVTSRLPGSDHEFSLFRIVRR
jgi:4-amino-4-deoxy-L-arabinose transferase-like glycosyltransferase